MKNKPTIIAVTLALCVLLFANYTVLKTAGSHPGSTGAPGDGTCSQSGCHIDALIVPNPNSVNKLIFSDVDTTYLPGQTYTLTVQVNSPNISKFGFELSALKDSTNTNAGTLGILDNVRTQLISHSLNGDVRGSVTHETAGAPALSPGFTEWKMKWTAPLYNAGNITFYYATICTNNDDQNTGDTIYLSSFKIKSAASATLTSLTNNKLEENIHSYYDHNTHQINLKYQMDNSFDAKILIDDCLGASVFNGNVILKKGEGSESISIPVNHAKGTYVVRVIIKEKTITKKIIVD